jgi:hypothetical protein
LCKQKLPRNQQAWTGGGGRGSRERRGGGREGEEESNDNFREPWGRVESKFLSLNAVFKNARTLKIPPGRESSPCHITLISAVIFVTGEATFVTLAPFFSQMWLFFFQALCVNFWWCPTANFSSLWEYIAEEILM